MSIFWIRYIDYINESEENVQFFFKYFLKKIKFSVYAHQKLQDALKARQKNDKIKTFTQVWQNIAFQKLQDIQIYLISTTQLQYNNSATFNNYINFVLKI